MEFAHIGVLPFRGGVDIGVGIGAEIFIDMAMGMGRNIYGTWAQACTWALAWIYSSRK